MDMQRRCGPEVKSGNAQEISSQPGGKESAFMPEKGLAASGIQAGFWRFRFSSQMVTLAVAHTVPCSVVQPKL